MNKIITKVTTNIKSLINVYVKLSHVTRWLHYYMKYKNILLDMTENLTKIFLIL